MHTYQKQSSCYTTHLLICISQTTVTIDRSNVNGFFCTHCRHQFQTIHMSLELSPPLISGVASGC